MQRAENAVLDPARAFVAPHAEVHRLQYVDLARRRPGAVMMILGQHPDRGPNTLPLRQLRAHLDPAIGPRRLAARYEPCRGERLGRLRLRLCGIAADRKSVVSGTRGSVRVELGG